MMSAVHQDSFMNHNMRNFGWVLFGMGAVFSLLTALALARVIPLKIDFFGFNLDTRGERFALVGGLVITALVGLVLLRVSRRSPKRDALSP